MAERQPDKKEKLGAGAVIAAGNLLGMVAIAGGVILGAIETGKEIKEEQYAPFNPAAESVLADKSHYDSSSGGIGLIPGPRGVPIIPYATPGSSEEHILVFEQDVRNGDGDTATAKGRMFVDEETYSEHEVGEQIVPNELGYPFEEIDAWREEHNN